MDIAIGAWNVKELNSILKLYVVNTIVRSNRVDIMGIMEIRIREVNSGLLSRFGNYWVWRIMLALLELLELLCFGNRMMYLEVV